MKTVVTKFEVKINVGDTMVKSLKNNDSFDWQFVSREKQTMKLRWVSTMPVYTYQVSLHQVTGTLRKHPQKQTLISK